LDESRGLKSKENEKINDAVTVDCKKFNLGLLSTYCSVLWGSLSYVNQTVSEAEVPNLILLSTFMQYKQKLPWCLISKLLKQHLGTIEADGDNHSVYINRQKAKDFAESGKVD
jgi:hypothetical protein